MLEVSVEESDLPSDLSYLVDCAIEQHDVGHDVGFWLRHFCPNVASIIDNNQQEVIPNQTLPHPSLKRINDDYQRWFRNTKTEWKHKVVCTAVGIRSIPYMIHDTARYIADSTIIEDSEFLIHTAPGTKLVKKYKPYKIHAKNGHNAISVFDWKPYIEKNYVTNMFQSIMNMCNRAIDLAPLPEEIRINFPPRRRRQFILGRDERKVIRRGVDLLADLIGYEATQRFIASKEIRVRGEKFDFCFRLGRLAQTSHGAVETTVYVGDTRICNLCIYTPDTPILDHIASMITHISGGSEDDLIRTGNPYRIAHTEPTGIAILDERLSSHIANIERVVVRNVVKPTIQVVRLGDSLLTNELKKRRAHRVLNHFYKSVFYAFYDCKFPKAKITTAHDCQI